MSFGLGIGTSASPSYSPSGSTSASGSTSTSSGRHLDIARKFSANSLSGTRLDELSDEDDDEDEDQFEDAHEHDSEIESISSIDSLERELRRTHRAAGQAKRERLQAEALRRREIREAERKAAEDAELLKYLLRQPSPSLGSAPTGRDTLFPPSAASSVRGSLSRKPSLSKRSSFRSLISGASSSDENARALPPVPAIPPSIESTNRRPSLNRSRVSSSAASVSGKSMRSPSIPGLNTLARLASASRSAAGRSTTTLASSTPRTPSASNGSSGFSFLPRRRAESVASSLSGLSARTAALSLAHTSDGELGADGYTSISFSTTIPESPMTESTNLTTPSRKSTTRQRPARKSEPVPPPSVRSASSSQDMNATVVLAPKRMASLNSLPSPSSPISVKQCNPVAQYVRSERLTRILTLKRAPYQGLKVSLADVGARGGHPIVVFLGLGAVRYLVGLYDDIAAAMGLRLICIDRWGLGRTDVISEERRDVLGWGSVVGEVLDQLGIGRFAMLAHSAGAPYAMATVLRQPSSRIVGPVHLLAPWAGPQVESNWKWLKYVPGGVIRTAQVAEWKMQSWKLGKQPSLAYEGVGYDANAARAENGSAYLRDKGLPTIPHDPHEDDTSSQGNHSGKKVTRTSLESITGNYASYSRMFDLNSPTEAGTTRSGIPLISPPPTIYEPQNTSLGSSQDLSMANSTSSGSGGSRKSESSQADQLNDIATALLRASHAEALRGGSADLMAILGRSSRPWGFAYTDVVHPVKVWHGDRDERISLASAQWMEQELPHCELIVVKGANHSLMTNVTVVMEALESLSRSLTDRQQTRLTAYLDDAFHKLNRGFLRRHEPHSAPSQQDKEKESWHPTIASAIAAWVPVLGLIVRIPPIGASAPLIVSQLLRATSELTEQITGYDLGEPTSAIVNDAPRSALPSSLSGTDIDSQLLAVLSLLDVLDIIWSDLIKGYAVDLYQQRLEALIGRAEQGSGADCSPAQPNALQTDPSGRFHQGRHSTYSDAIGTRPAASFLPFPPPTPSNPHDQSSSRQARRLPGSPLSLTERIRLRNVSLLARDRLFRWMREVLDAPPPPEVEEDDIDPDDSEAPNAARQHNGTTGSRGHGSRVAALLQYDMQASQPRKRRRVETFQEEKEHDNELLQEEREFAELAGEQGDLDAGMSPLRDEAVDEAVEEDDDPEEEASGPQQGPEGNQTEEGQPPDAGLPDMEEVDVAETGEDRQGSDPAPGPDAGPGDERAEIRRDHDHYDDLFSRKLDPDASDEEDNAAEEGTAASPPGSSSDSNDQETQGRRGRRRARSGSIDSADAHTLKSAALPPAHSIVGQWDLEFSRCFRRTLRLLAEATEKGQD
ncbi:hypothetical protein OC846_002899 [Tilletia horrida]|uniref:AB hydrolase-1 domain-containing protein n=1 Tax=Tilletia horrida TaxID=155126 RepID=A0AAN6JS76_9BASI|nr:hypothetical protein OC846_002899 [Tilletia horrida]